MFLLCLLCFFNRNTLISDTNRLAIFDKYPTSSNISTRESTFAYTHSFSFILFISPARFNKVTFLFFFPLLVLFSILHHGISVSINQFWYESFSLRSQLVIWLLSLAIFPAIHVAASEFWIEPFFYTICNWKLKIIVFFIGFLLQSIFILLPGKKNILLIFPALFVFR